MNKTIFDLMDDERNYEVQQCPICKGMSSYNFCHCDSCYDGVLYVHEDVTISLAK